LGSRTSYLAVDVETRIRAASLEVLGELAK